MNGIGVGAGWPLLAALGGWVAGPAAAAGDVDLAKSTSANAGPAWVGRTVGEVLDAAAIERVVLLKALTSTTADRDLDNIRRILAAAAGEAFLDEPSPPTLLRLGHADSTWEAVIVAADGAVFGFTAGGERACLRASDGRTGCFVLPRPSL